jgi:DNA-binding transcriptional regulator YiaG
MSNTTTPPAESTGTRYPFRGPFFQEVSKRKDQGKDAKIVVSSANAETGVGKSTLACYLAFALDTSANGFRAEEKTTLNVEEFLEKYDSVRKGSALILDEAEQIDSRRSMSQTNVDAAEHWQTRRVREVCAILTLPKFEVLDARMRDLVDYRIDVNSRGHATLFKKSHRQFSGDVWWQPLQDIRYPNMDGTRAMERIHGMKSEYIDASTSASYVDEEQAQQQAQQQAEEEVKQREKEIAKDLYWSTEMSQREIADKFDVSQPTIANWVKQAGKPENTAD